MLGEPTRRRILDLVVASPEPITIASITEAVRLHHNTIRQHLAKLCSAGLVIETREQRETPGRPRLLYRAAPTPTRGTSDHYRRLAWLLLQVAQSGGSAREVGRDAGIRDGIRSRRTTDPVAALARENARNGFMPARVERSGRVELVLNRCPIADVASSDPTIICALHRGLAEGFLEARGNARVTALIANDPYRAGCRIRLATNDN